MASTALLTDHYELTMLQAALAGGTAQRRSVFELFGRRLPEGRRYGVVAGVGRALDAIEAFRFDDEALAALDGRGRRRRRWSGWPTTGSPATSGATPRARSTSPHSPLLIVEASFAEAVVLETVLLSIYNHDSAIASAASRMTLVAGDRPCIEMGSRRTHEEAAVAAARAAYVAGFATTSNLAARAAVRRPDRRHERALLHAAARHRGGGVPRPGELARRRARRCWSTPTTSPRRSGSASRWPGPGSARSASTPATSGVLAHQVRAQLDSLGATETRIVVTSDLDEYAIAALAAAPVDGYGVGTQLVTGSGHPTSGFVYKLVAREDGDGELQSVAKKSVDKISVGGRKYALRRRDAARRGRGRGDRHRHAGRRTTATTGSCWSRWSATARWSAASRSTPPGSGTSRPAPSCRRPPSRCREGEPVIPTVFEGDA